MKKGITLVEAFRKVTGETQRYKDAKNEFDWENTFYSIIKKLQEKNPEFPKSTIVAMAKEETLIAEKEYKAKILQELESETDEKLTR